MSTILNIGAALRGSIFRDPRLLDRLPASVRAVPNIDSDALQPIRANTAAGVAVLDAIDADPRLIDRLPARVVDAIDAFGTEVMAS